MSVILWEVKPNEFNILTKSLWINYEVMGEVVMVLLPKH